MIKNIFFFCLFFLFSIPAFSQTDVIDQVFSTLNQDYVNVITNKDIALKGLKALSNVDKNVTINEKENTLILSYPAKEPQTFAFPAQDNISSWVDFCKNVINKASQMSERLETIDFELEDRFAAAVFNGLDGYSHYFSVFGSDEEDKPFKIKRPFASRVIDNTCPWAASRRSGGTSFWWTFRGNAGGASGKRERCTRIPRSSALRETADDSPLSKGGQSGKKRKKCLHFRIVFAIIPRHYA